MSFFSKIVCGIVLIFALPIEARIDYQITIDQPSHHLAKIKMTFTPQTKHPVVKLPGWRTGKYQLLNQANGVRFFKANDGKGNPIQSRRLSKDTWEILAEANTPVSVSYQIYANELGYRSRHIDSTHAYLDATAVLMYSPELTSQVHSVSLTVPKNWKSFSGMVETAPHQFIAQNYDQLADSPIETGINELIAFTEDGRDYQVVFWGKSNRANQKIADDLKKLVSTSQTIWKGYPYKKYVFIVHATDGATGATEHINSTVIQRPWQSFAKRSDYLDRFLRTASHEVVHTWNVKAYRPRGLVPYDYQAENYTDLLWIAEGATSYLQDHLLLAAELQTVEEYLKALSKRIDAFNRRPGAQIQSVSAASFEKWIAQGGDFANNFGSSIYSEGFMANWLIDAMLIEDSNLQSSIKSVHNLLYQIDNDKRTGSEFIVTPYDADKVKQLMQSLTGKDYSAWWEKNIETNLEIDFSKLLNKAGLEFEPLKDKDYEIWAGFSTNDSNGFLTLSKVEMNGPAWKAGLTTGDQIVAIDQFKVTNKTIEEWLKQYEAGEQVEVIFFRNAQLMQKNLVLEKMNKKPVKIVPIESPTESQKAFFKRWLGIEFPKKKASK